MGTDQANRLLDQIERWWLAGERHAILVTGNTGDDVSLGSHDGRLCDVLAGHLAERFDLVLRYDLAYGLRAAFGGDNLRDPVARGRLPLENALPTDAVRVAREILAGEAEQRIAFVIDGVDDLVSAGAVTAAPTERACLQQLERLSDDPRIASAEHVVIAVSADANPLLGRLTQPSSRWLRVDIPVPDEPTRLAAIDDVLELDDAPELDGLDPFSLARLTRGMTCTELRHELMSTPVVTVREVHRMRAAAIERAANGLLEVIDLRAGGWAEAPGLDYVRRAFEELIEADGALSRFAGDGVLLAGPPGCGKSISVKALAAERPIPCLALADLRTRWYGESERNLSNVFRVLLAFAPCLVFIDEFDQMVGRRTEGGDGVGGADQRLFGRFLAFMEETRRSGAVLWVGATNIPAAIDEAMLARLPRVLPILLPGPRARTEILAAVARSLRADDARVDWELVARRLPNAASRDLEHVVRRAALLTSGALTPEAVETVVAAWRPPASLADLHAWSVAALKHVRFALDMPPNDDLPEHLVRFVG